MSPEEERKEKIAQLSFAAVFAAVAASAVGGLFWAAAKGKDTAPSAQPAMTEQGHHSLEKEWTNADKMNAFFKHNGR